ncbi:MAG: NAD(P)-dependent oxidoreductase [Flavobacteriales bacterium]|nr:NAD(P)-dependent oxidoreductase [Flavobacteriales bacterium]
MKKFLITGANGLLGQKLVSLLHQEVNVCLLATAQGDCRFNLPSGVTFQSLDITDADACAMLFQEFQPDVLFHTAAMTQVDACEDERERCDLINVTGVSNLIKAIGDFDTHFIHISTDFIYKGDASEYFEHSKADPLSYYGLSKWKSEQLFTEVSFPYTILRTVLVYGVLDDLSRTNIVLWAKGALEKGQEIQVVDDQFRCPTLAEDLALACLLVSREKATGTYHISGKDFLSVLEIVHEIADFWNLDKQLINSIPTSSLSQKAKRPPKTKLNISKAMQHFNYQPKSFREGLVLVDKQIQNLKLQ